MTCENKEHCKIYGMKDKCGLCPHYNEILHFFFNGKVNIDEMEL